MNTRVSLCGAAMAAVCLLTGCHHRAVVRAVPPPIVPAPAAEPVMVSVPPPSHRSTDAPEGVEVHSSIPVVKPVKPQRRTTRRQPPAVAANTAPPANTTPAPSPAAAAPAVNLGQLTSSTDDPAATRDGAANAIRRERDRLGSVSSATASAHVNEIEQVRRFLKSAADSWNGADYAAALALTTKARVLLDDLSK